MFDHTQDLDRLLEAIPKDSMYHIERRSEAYLSLPVL